MPREHADDVRDSYDQVAAEYAERFVNELDHKPLDRALLASFAEQVQGKGIVADIGCGPGHVARYLSERGVETVGVDLSPEMVATARRLQPGLEFVEGSILELPVEDGVWAGIVAFYSIIHIPEPELPQAATEFYRALRPGGLGMISFHIGSETRHFDEWWGKAVNLDFYFFPVETVVEAVEGAGFAIEARIERRPYEPHEVATQRCYLLVRKW